MLTRDDAIRIAESATMIRPDWLRASLVTLLGEFKAKNVRDVHLAILWIAYDPQTRTPARLREDGPWWHLGTTTSAAGHPAAPALPPWRDTLADAPKATPDVVAHYANQVREAARNATIPERPRPEGV